LATNPYHILALDGGGLRGIFTTAVLVEAEDAFGESFLASFDLLVGTSTGGVIALGLASGRTCHEILDFYRTLGPKIFSRPRRIRRLIRPKYDRAPLDLVLRQYFGEALRLNDLIMPVCITAHELVSGGNRVIKDDHSPELRWGGDQLVWKVAAATAAAPTYFAPVQLSSEDSHVDGGVWGNNPAMVGIVEAIRYADRDLADIRLLSIGTTSRSLRVRNHKEALKMGLLQWMPKGLDLLQGSSSMAADNQARLLLGDNRYLRLDSDSARKVNVDDVRQCLPLQEWGHDVGRKNVALIGRLLGLARR
jgi:patatin-like phospholipase/acyl hydrolase